MNVIELRGIGKTFTDRDEPTVALENINLAIAPGEFVAIIGPSGSGKSTLMNVLGLLDTPTTGEYLLDGQPVGKLRDRKLAHLRRDKIGFVFQSFNLLPRLSVLANVELPLIYAGVRGRKRRQRALELLKLVHLENRAGYKPRQISGGQTQRVAIARALTNHPSLILADEPTGNLDSKSSDEVINELRRLNRETAATIVIVTHNPEIAALTDRTITVRDGRLVGDQANRRVARKGGAQGNSSEQADAGSVAAPARHADRVRQREDELPAAKTTRPTTALTEETRSHPPTPRSAARGRTVPRTGNVIDLRDQGENR